MRSVAFYTLGCKLNFSESSALGRSMEEHGYEVKPFHEVADIYVINTCSVTDNADKKCKKVVREALRTAPDASVVIVGCYAQLKPEEITRIPGVDLVLGASEKFRLPEFLDTLQKNASPKYFAKPVAEATTFHSAFSFGERTRAFLKVQDGCDYTCAFCTIPLARGASRSSSIAEVVEQAEKIAALDVREIVLTGVNIGDFGQEDEDFYGLMQALDTVNGIDRIRISSIEPNLLTPDIIDFVAASETFVPHFHIPLQSGSDMILRRMRRRYLRDVYSDRVQRIRAAMPHACIGVDVITGFPGETDEAFAETYQFLLDLDISYLHVFTYSERPNTHALTLDGVVPQKKREERTTQLRNLSEKKRRAFYDAFAGSIRPVLFEAERNGARMHGFTDNYIRVETAYDPLLVNTIVPVQLGKQNADGYMLAEHIFDDLDIWNERIHAELKSN
ncbi:MAG: tRNA (N(6)-L-threonylcarbamoyladenosine(37)-C(2))-methylthiotransferase MtaB [Chitinophagales bacterium]